MEFLAFPSIESFHNIVKAVTAYPHLAITPIRYRGKIKLHGTNASVRVNDKKIRSQSRTQIITPDNDNAGFAKWVEIHRDFFINLTNCTVFGEFCGPGIMKGTAINGIPNKVFAIFAIMIGDDTQSAVMVTEPAEIEQMLGDRPNDVYILPWQGEEFEVHYSDKNSLQNLVDQLNKVVEEIEPNDPWVKATFGIDGICEGVVYVPGAGKRITRKQYSDLAFKAKGEKHKVNQNKEKKAVVIDPTVAASVSEFVQLFATEARFEQGLSVVGSTEMKNMGSFLKWVAQDVLKESADELEASKLEWSQVEKSIQSAARSFFILKNKTISV